MNENLDDSFKEIKDQYEKTIPDKIKSIEEAFIKLKKDTKKENVEELRMIVHKIAGSAGMYGYDEVSVDCKAIDLELKDWLEKSEESLPEKELSDLEHALEKVKKGFKK